MSDYTQYYTAADVYVIIEHPQGITEPVLIDTLSSFVYAEKLTSAQVFGLNNPLYGFINSGNVIVNGVLELNFTDELYLKCALEDVMIQSSQFEGITTEDVFSSKNTDMVSQYALSVKKERKFSDAAGILSYPQNFNLRVVFNNGNIYHGDINKDIVLTGCKIVGTQQVAATSSPGQVAQQFNFIASEVIT